MGVRGVVGGGYEREVVVKHFSVLFFVSVFHAAGRMSVTLKAGDSPAAANCSRAPDNRTQGDYGLR